MLNRFTSYIGKKLIYFGNNSNIHCVRYITETNHTWMSRIFWIIALTLSGWGLLIILSGTLKSSSQDTLNFTPDTNRLLWNTVFPSVTVCEKYTHSQSLKKLNKYYPEFMKNINYDYKKMFTEIFFTESYCKLCKTGCTADVNCSIDWREMAEKVREPCSELIHTCTWQGIPLDCCKYFLPIDSEFGICYSFNTLQSRLSGTVPIFKSNRTTGPGYLSFYVYKRLLVYIHGTEDIPWKKSDLDMRLDVKDDNIDFRFQIIEVSNDPSVSELSIDIRKCRYKNEIYQSDFAKPFKLYGYSTCMTTCKTELMFKYCQCVHHLRDITFKNITCNYTGLVCLSQYADEQNQAKADNNQDNCEHCIPSCEEIELTKIYSNEEETDEDYPRVDIKMEYLPNIQYQRNVVRTNLDLVVSIGGLAGLFFGASLLTIVEAIYLIFIREISDEK